MHTPVKLHYGGDLEGLHPDRNEVLLEALDRFERGRASKADLVLLWFDVALCEALAQKERFRKDFFEALAGHD
jgi:hypothetical protein